MELAKKLRALIVADYAVVRSGSTLTISDSAGIVVGISVSASTDGSMTSDTTTATTRTVTFDNSPTVGEEWIVEWNDGTTTFDASLPITASITTTAQATTALALLINVQDDVIAAAEGNTIAITKQGGGTLTAAHHVAMDIDDSVSFNKHQVRLTGTADADDSWTVEVDGIPFSSTESSSRAASVVATAIAGSIDGHGSYTASADAFGVITITKDAGGDVTVALAGDAEGNVATRKRVNLSGAWDANDAWSLSADAGTAATHTDTGSSLLSDVATSLAGNLSAPAGIEAFDDGSTVVILKAAGGSLAVDARLTPQGSVGTTAETTLVHLSGTASNTEVWDITVDGNPHAAPASNDIATILQSLVGDLHDDIGYTANSEGNTIAVTKLSGAFSSINATVSPPASTGSGIISGTPESQWSQEIEISGLVETDDVWTVLVDGTPRTYIVENTDSTIGHVADEIAEEIDDLGSYTATASGDTITVTKNDSSVVRIDSVEQLRKSAFTLGSNTTDSRQHYNDADIQLQKASGRALPGEIWTVELQGVSYAYQIPSTGGGGSQANYGMSLQDVATELTDLVDDDFPLATNSGATISVPGLNGATVEVKRGNGTVRTVFDVDGGATTSATAVPEVVSLFPPVVAYHEILTSTFVELLNSSGVLLADGVQDSQGLVTTTLDPGSSTLFDPRLEYQFDAPGVYQVRVGTYRQSLDGHFPNENFAATRTGVAAGISYDLNVSIENHATNPAVLELTGKTVVIVDGAGTGESATITGYDPESKLLSLGGSIAGIDETSVFEVTAAFSAAPVTDTYDIVLTSQPAIGETVTIDVLPQLTRTYNSKLAFDELANNGEANALQVDVDKSQLTFDHNDWNTPKTVTVTAKTDTIADGQDAAVFPAFEERVAGIRGPLAIEGGVRVTEDRFLDNPFLLPSETNLPVADGNVTAAGVSSGSGQDLATLTDTTATHVNPRIGAGQPGLDPRMNDALYEFLILSGPAKGAKMEVASVDGDTVTFTTDWPDGIVPQAGDTYYFAPVNPNFNVTESTQIDVVDIFNRDSISDDTGTLTADQLSGFGLGPDTVIGGEAIEGGIHYANIEELNLLLGQGANDLTIESTHVGTTNVVTQARDDQFEVKTVFGHTTIDAGAGADDVEIGSDANRVDQITGLLTILGGDGADSIHIDDSGDQSDDFGTLNATSLVGLDMPLVPEVQFIDVRAAGGSFALSSAGYGTDAGFADSANVTRDTDSAIVFLDYDSSEAEVSSRITELYGLAPGSLDVTVSKSADDYRISIAGELAGIDLPELVWDESASSLTAAAQESVDVRVTTLRDGTAEPDLSTIQTLTLNATGGTFGLTLLDQSIDNIAHDVTTEELQTLLDPVLNPNNSRLDKPHTNNVAVRRHGDVIQIEFRGEHRTLGLEESNIDATQLTGDIELQTRIDGIDYFDISSLSIELGGGSDVLNVQATHANTVTSIQTHDGDDEVHVASTADGSFVDQDVATGDLDDVDGQLNLDAGSGSNSLFVSDSETSAGDANVVITDSTIDGLAAGQITYTSTGGNFDSGLSIWTSQLADSIDITSVDVGSETITSLYTGAGNDDVRVEVADAATPAHTTLPQGIDRRLRVRTQTGDDVVDASRSELALRIESGVGTDIVKGGHGDDRIHAGDGSDIVFGGDGNDYLDATNDAPGATPFMDNEIVFGDHGIVVFNVAGGGTHQIDSIEPTVSLDSYRRAAFDTLSEITSNNANGGGLDEIHVGDRRNIVLGGLRGDNITAGADNDFVFGDGGSILFNLGVLASASSVDDGLGGMDTIHAGDGHNIVLGGTAADTITTGLDRDFVAGDNGDMTFAPDETILSFRSTTTFGTGDVINTGGDRDYVVAGAGDDAIETGSGSDVVIGDHGELNFAATGLLTSILSTDETAGGIDTINAGNGLNVVVGGVANDSITTGSGRDYVLGDNGEAIFAADETVLTLRSTTNNGGADFITTGAEADFVIAGAEGDVVGTGSGDSDDVVLGDHGELSFDANGLLTRAITTDPNVGGDDQVYTQEGRDVVLGGPGKDRLIAGADDARDSKRDVVIGDSGIAEFDSSFNPTFVATLDVSLGDNDTIVTGGGDDVVLAGAADDIILVGAGDDIGFGDNADATFVNGVWMRLTSTSPSVGGYDQILGSFGDDILVAGADRDFVLGGANGDDIILGDSGLVVGADGSPEANDIISTGFTLGGGVDKIFVEDGWNKIIGGDDADNITGGSIRDWIAGDYADIRRSPLWRIEELVSVDEARGGNDGISGGGGFDVIVAGAGSDIASGHGGNDVVVGDNAQILTNSESIYRVTTTGQGIGDVDTLYGDTGDDYIFGGAGGDTLDGGIQGNDVIVGDNAVAHFTSLKLQELISIDPSVGGDDQILGREQSDVIFGGLGNDTIDAGTDDGADVVVGDHGRAAFDIVGGASLLREVETTDVGHAGDDDILTGDGPDVILAGGGGDTVDSGSEQDLVLGDNGIINFNVAGEAVLLTSNATSVGGDDTLLTGTGDDVVFGGAAADRIESMGGNDLVLGDSGEASFVAGNYMHIKSLAQTVGGDDVILADEGDDIVIGGAAGDTILGGENGDDLIVGDNAAIYGPNGSAQADDIITTGYALGGGVDKIQVSDGRNIIIGGDDDDNITAGSDRDWIAGDYVDVIRDGGLLIQEFVSTSDSQGGADGISAGGGWDIVIAGADSDTASGHSGRDILVGDNGRILATGDTIHSIESTLTNIGGDDTLFGNAHDDVIFGGFGNDAIDTGIDTGADVVVGDHGRAAFDHLNGSSVLREVKTTDVAHAGDDDIETGDGPDVILAGGGGDTVDSGTEQDLVLGDNGRINFNEAGEFILLTSTDTSVGGDDTLITGTGDDVVFGGAAADRIESMEGDDIVLGDSGQASFVSGNYMHIRSFAQTMGDDDVILADEGNDIVIGGAAGDTILGGENGDDVIVGDNAVIYGPNGTAQSNDIITTGYTLGGGIDKIQVSDGRNIIIGGDDDDNIAAGSQRDWIAGDYVDIVRDGGFSIQEFVSTADSQGGADGISAGGGWDIVVAGANGDTISGHSGKDILLGDNGRILANSDHVQRVESTSPNVGGDDTVFGNAHDDVIFGGNGADDITAGTNNDTVFGDNAIANLLANASVVDAAVLNPTNGGNDTIAGDEGRDRIFGGTGSDTISGGTDHDVIFGDHGRYDSSLPIDQNFVSTFISDNDGAAADTIHGDAGDDFILGGQGGDTLFGDAGEDDITGGHNVRFGTDGDDIIDAGTEADVILGENGTIHRTMLPNAVDQWELYTAPFGDVVRQVTRFDDIDRVTGDDTINSGSGDDRVFGQRGNDTIDGGAGDDELIGHLGDDNIQGGDDHDTILADVGTIVREWNVDGTAKTNANGSWHRNVVLEEVGSISGVVDMDQTPLRTADAQLAEKLIATDLLVLSGGLNSVGEKLNNSDNGAWDTDILLIDLVAPNHDVVDGGAGDDHIFGQRGNDTLSGGADNDHIFGDNMTNTVAHSTELPKAVHTYRLLDTADATIVLDEAGSVIVTPVTQRPEEVELNNPYGLPDNYGNLWSPIARDLASHAGNLQRADGSQTRPIVGVVPDVVHHIDVLPGNDTISGNDGDDFIVADDADAYSPLVTGFESIEALGNVSDQTQFALARAIHSLGLLGVDYQRETDGTSSVAHDVIVASDTIDGGAGEDHIVGDDVLIVGDIILGLPVESDELSDAALQLQEYLNDVEHLAIDLEQVAFEAHFQVLTGLLGTGAASTPDPDYHDLVIGNDTIVGGADNDVITGDHGAILTSIVDGQQFNTIDGNYDAAAWNAAATALESAASTRQTELDSHTASHHNTANRTLTPSQLSSLPIDFEYDRSIGNDDIQSNAGDDLVVGDFGTYAFPILDTTPITTAEQQTATSEIDILTNGLARWLEDQHHNNTYDIIASGYDHPLFDQRGGSSVEWQMLAGNDVIDAGADNDFVLGDSYSISSNIIKDDLTSQFYEDESQFKVAFLDRSRFELSQHFARLGGLSVFGNDTIHGGSGNDTLFGQTQNNTLFGEDGDDELFGGQGPDNFADGGPGGGTARAGSSIDPYHIWLDLVRTVQFESVSPTTTMLAMDVSTALEPNQSLTFDWMIGNLSDSMISSNALAFATTQLLVMP